MKECKCTLAQKVVGDGCSICNPQLMIEMLQEQIQELEATIEAQEIIIKDMAQPKTCYGCKHIEIHIYRAHKTATCTNKKCNEMYYCDVGSDFCCNYYEPKAQYE